MNLQLTDVRTARRVLLRGRVQGLGVRPAVARLAQRLGLAGYVRNTHAGVEVHVEGPPSSVSEFVARLPAALPHGCALEIYQHAAAMVQGIGGFEVHDLVGATEDASGAGRPAPMSAHVPTDMVACPECLDETRQADDRRHQYAFTSCTRCGPRYSIIQQMPYERGRTTMARFALCAECRHEFLDPDDRRFHAQTTACPRCGPRWWACDRQGRTLASGPSATQLAARALEQGEIVALLGLGGFQLLADATSESAVARLRRRKKRVAKPLAVLVATIDEAHRLAQLSAAEASVLQSAEGPIVVARRRADAPLAPSVSLSLPTVGLMLPTTPLHFLLSHQVARPLVCTSGNVEGEPLAYKADDAFEQLAGIADLLLVHDRAICRPIDDSVVSVMAGRVVTLRAARGLAPLPLQLDASVPLIAVGGHQKAAAALTNGVQAVLGPHIGDLDGLVARQRFLEQLDALIQLYHVDDAALVADMHPEYFTSRWAAERPRRCVAVQHHHAHTAAAMLEHGWLDREVLGVAFDGTGWGADGTVWGGEFLASTVARFRRVAHLRPFRLPGGDRAAREPWRVAVALVHDALGPREAASLALQSGSAAALVQLLSRPRLAPTTTSAGRLLDGLACLILGIERSRFEGEAAMLLEAACDETSPGRYRIPVTTGEPMQLDWRPLVRDVLRDRRAGVSPGVMAMGVHRALVGAIVAMSDAFPHWPVVVGGGVFQNRVLVELIAEAFDSPRRSCGLPGRIPPNDGGLAAGQLAVATARFARGAGPCV